VAGLLTIVTGSFHTTMHDHFKNVFLIRATAMAKIWARQSSAIAPNLRSARWECGWYGLVLEFSEFSAPHAAIYRKHAGSLMRIWRSFFGVGSLVFGLAVTIGFDAAEYYLLFRLVVLNTVFYGYMRPRQCLASQRTFEEMAGAG
jgi:hypothetical protein